VCHAGVIVVVIARVPLSHIVCFAFSFGLGLQNKKQGGIAVACCLAKSITSAYYTYTPLTNIATVTVVVS
jgi:hypothetical protein